MRYLRLLTAALLLSTGVVALGSASGAAAAAVPTGNVTRDALPTVQIDGVAWSQAIVGTTVYVGGSFANARPAGAASGTNLTPRANLLAYDITTGNLITSFAHTTNGQVRAVVASPDGTRVYIGGDFTQVDSQLRDHIAAFDTKSGSLVAGFAPDLNGNVRGLTVTNTVVYAGGEFTTANGANRSKLAAFKAANGATTAWAPKPNTTVNAVQLTPDGTRVIVGGSFKSVSGTAALGLASVDATSGAVQSFAANQVVQDYGSSSAILSLSIDANTVYGTGYVYGSPGNFEGTFAADPSTGAIKWLADCHGDTYGAYSNGTQVYVVSHEHDCSNVGGFPDTNPRNKWYRSTAFTAAATGTVQTNSAGGYTNFAGQPSPTLLNWFPGIDTGTYTGQDQGSWTVTGNSQYVAEGGEFLHVNNVAQQGLVRFAVHALAPNAFGPSGIGALTATSGGSGSGLTISATAAYDPDDQYLTYKLIRNGATTPVATATYTVPNFWQAAPTVSLTDPNAVAGTVYAYRIDVTDPGGKTLKSSTVNATMPTDLALNRPASQSSDAFGATAARAVDGNTDGVFNDGSVTHTNTDPNSWWQVDLGSAQPVANIAVWNRTDCCSDRLSDYWVFASNSPFDTTLSPSQQAATAGVWSAHLTSAPAPTTSVPLPAGTKARYVMVQENTSNQNLSLAEVQVLSPTSGLLAVDRSGIAFPTTTVGSSSSATFTLSNQGVLPVTIKASSGPGAPFTVSPAISVGQVLNPGASVVETVTYAPTTPNTNASSLSITADDGRPATVVALSGATDNDIAVNQPASQSSDAFWAGANRAVDGNTDGVFNDNSVTHTNADPNSWWQVDLGASRPIDYLTVWNRTDCCGDRLADYWVFVSNTPFTTSLTPAQQATQSGVWSTHRTSAPNPSTAIALPQGATGRYVMVQENVVTNLSLAEVQVWSPPAN